MYSETKALTVTLVLIAAISLAPFLAAALGVGDATDASRERQPTITAADMTTKSTYGERNPAPVAQLQSRANRIVINNKSFQIPPLIRSDSTTDTESIVVVGAPTSTLPAVVQPEEEVKHVATVVPEPVRAVVPLPTATAEVVEVAPDTDAVSEDFISLLAHEIHRRTNQERERAGLPALAYDADLAAIALKHSDDMARNDYFSHTAQDGCDMTCRFEQAEYTAQSWGENLAWRSSSQLPEVSALAAYFVREWMNSSGHRRNILSSNYTHEGVGVVRVGDKVYVTVNFAD